MTDLKEKALAKMNEEMSKAHGQAVDVLHNMLCVCDNDEIYQGILKDGKTVAGAYDAMFKYAAKNKSGNSYGMDAELAMSIVKDYLNDTTKTANVKDKPMNVPDSTFKARTSEMSEDDRKLLEWAKKEKDRQEKAKAEKEALKAEASMKKQKGPDVLMDIFDFIDPSDTSTKAMINEPEPDYEDLGDESDD